MKKFLTTKDVAGMLQVQDRRTVLAFLAQNGVLPVKVGRLLRWDADEVMLAIASMHHANERPRRQVKRAKKTPHLLTMSADEVFRTVCGAASASLQ